LLDCEGLSASGEAFELRPVGVLVEERDLTNFFTVCSSASPLVMERILSKVTGR